MPRVKSLKLTEAEFTAQVIQYARLRGWRTAHFRPARTARGWRTAIQGDGKGWPDLILVRGTSVIAAELKIGRNRLTAEQAAWLRALDCANVMTYVWRPADWPKIEKVLA